MPNTGISLSSLTERVRAKTEQDSQAVERLTRERFESLSKNLSTSSNAALSSTEAAILHQLTSLEQSVTSRCRILSAAFGWKCLQAMIITLCILTGITLGGWGLMTLGEKKITKLHREITMLSERKDSLEAQNARIWNSFKGLEPYQDTDGKNYLLTPEGWTITHGGTTGKRDAWKIVRK